MIGPTAVVSYPPAPMVDLGYLRLSVHGLFIVAGVLVGVWIATHGLRRAGGDGEQYHAVLGWALVAAIVGARYLTAPAAILAGEGLSALHPFSGNFSIMGGFAGGIVVGWWRLRSSSLRLLPTLDASSYGLALGTVVGRLGCLAIVEHLGPATTLPWGYGVRPGYRVAPQHTALECTVAGADGFCGVYHPVALYDLLGAGLLLGVLLLLAGAVRLRPGQLFAVWMAWYGLQRFLLDSLRYGTGDATVGPFTWNQLSGLAAGVAGIALLWRWGRLRAMTTSGRTA